jgi:hypothetical protein
MCIKCIHSYTYIYINIQTLPSVDGRYVGEWVPLTGWGASVGVLDDNDDVYLKERLQQGCHKI